MSDRGSHFAREIEKLGGKMCGELKEMGGQQSRATWGGERWRSRKTGSEMCAPLVIGGLFFLPSASCVYFASGGESRRKWDERRVTSGERVNYGTSEGYMSVSVYERV